MPLRQPHETPVPPPRPASTFWNHFQWNAFCIWLYTFMKISKLHSRIDTYQPRRKQHHACYPAAYLHPLVISTPNSHPRACQATTRFFTSAATTRFPSGVATTRLLAEKQGWMPDNTFHLPILLWLVTPMFGFSACTYIHIHSCTYMYIYVCAYTAVSIASFMGSTTGKSTVYIYIYIHICFLSTRELSMAGFITIDCEKQKNGWTMGLKKGKKNLMF